MSGDVRRTPKRVGFSPAATEHGLPVPSNEEEQTISCASSGSVSSRASNQNTDERDGKPGWYTELGESEVDMFKKVFDLLDQDGGGSIDAPELYNMMKNLDIDISLEEISSVLRELDSDGNGEIDFDEFLYAMASTDRYLDMLAEDSTQESQECFNKRQTLFFTAITKFATKNSLGEISRYYAAKAKQVPHVISHYTAGARLIGLTDRQLQQHLRKMQREAKSNKSPYAKPLQFVLPDTMPKKRKEKQKAKPVVTSHGRTRRTAITGDSHPEELEILTTLRQLADEGSVLARLPGVHLIPQVRRTLKKTKKADSVPICSSNRKRRKMAQDKQSKEHSHTHLAFRANNGKKIERRSLAAHGWKSQQIEICQVPLPKLPVKKTPQAPTIDDLPSIRRTASQAIGKYFDNLRTKKVQTSWEHWSELHTEEIKSKKLYKNFKRVFRTYSPHEETFMISPWFPSTPQPHGHQRTKETQWSRPISSFN